MAKGKTNTAPHPFQFLPMMAEYFDNYVEAALV
jgi:hypothetical protein